MQPSGKYADNSQTENTCSIVAQTYLSHKYERWESPLSQTYGPRLISIDGEPIEIGTFQMVYAKGSQTDVSCSKLHLGQLE